MDIAGVQRGMVGMALFDMWMDSIRKSHKARRAIGSPLLAAASEAFEAYVAITEAQIAAEISGLSIYALTPKGTIQIITPQQMAPFLALNVLA